VHPVPVAQGKRQALAALPDAFASRRARAAEEAEALQARLYQESGPLKVEQYTRTPFCGTRRMTAWLRREGSPVNRQRVRRLLPLLGLEAIDPKPPLSAFGLS
jgi:hypothetical protein